MLRFTDKPSKNIRYSKNTLIKVTVKTLIMFSLSLSIVFMGRANKTEALVNSYLGSGWFGTNNLNRCHVGGYSTQAQNASARWSADTDVNMFYNCSGTQITTKNANWGNVGWAGQAYICNTNGQCGSSAYNATYSSCEARLNQWSFNNIPGYTNAEIEKLATHELGHCYSLDHATNPSVMNNSSVPQTQDISLINYRY